MSEKNDSILLNEANIGHGNGLAELLVPRKERDGLLAQAGRLCLTLWAASLAGKLAQAPSQLVDLKGKSKCGCFWQLCGLIKFLVTITSPGHFLVPGALAHIGSIRKTETLKVAKTCPCISLGSRTWNGRTHLNDTHQEPGFVHTFSHLILKTGWGQCWYPYLQKRNKAQKGCKCGFHLLKSLSEPSPVESTALLHDILVFLSTQFLTMDPRTHELGEVSETQPNPFHCSRGKQGPESWRQCSPTHMLLQ